MNELSTIQCPHFGACSGCTISGKVDLPPIWEEVSQYFFSHGVRAQLVSGKVCQWRTKAKLAVRKNVDGVQIGLFKTRSHVVLPIPYCKVHHPSINLAVQILTEKLEEENVPIYDEKSKSGCVRYIQCFVDLKTLKVQLTIVAQQDHPSLRSFHEKIKNDPIFCSIWLNIQPSTENRIFGNEWIHLSGEEFLKQELARNLFYFHPAAFSQAHWTLFEKMVDHIEKWIEPGAKLSEIYAGIGVMGTVFAPKCQIVHLIESNPFAEKSFAKAKSHSNVKYFLQDAADANLNDIDHLLIDPPRKGVDGKLLEKIKKFNGKIICISCNFQTFVRDVEELIQTGFRVKDAKCYLLFPGTDHVEVTAILEKNGGSKWASVG